MIEQYTPLPWSVLDLETEKLDQQADEEDPDEAMLASGRIHALTLLHMERLRASRDELLAAAKRATDVMSSFTAEYRELLAAIAKAEELK